MAFSSQKQTLATKLKFRINSTMECSRLHRNSSKPFQRKYYSFIVVQLKNSQGIHNDYISIRSHQYAFILVFIKFFYEHISIIVTEYTEMQENSSMFYLENQNFYVIFQISTYELIQIKNFLRQHDKFFLVCCVIYEYTFICLYVLLSPKFSMRN